MNARSEPEAWPTVYLARDERYGRPVACTQPLSLAQWGLIVLVGTTVIAGGELDKWWSRRHQRPLG